MLKKQNRLTTRYQFNITRKFGYHLAGKYIHIYVLEPRNYRGPSQFGIVVSNKLSKAAVVRNKVKRRIRNIIKNEFAKINPNQWIVLHSKQQILQATYEEIDTDIAKILQKIPFSR